MKFFRHKCVYDICLDILGSTACEISEVPQWSGNRFWSQGSKVRSGNQIYVASATMVAADPTYMAHVRFHVSIFDNQYCK